MNTQNKKHTTLQNAFHNLHIDCESSDQFTRYNNTPDDDSMFIFGAEEKALDDIHIDCESSDGYSRHEFNDLEPFSIQGTAEPERSNKSFKRYVQIIRAKKSNRIYA
jgi:hypothetical protein